jgi:hypothetical protein
MCGICIQQRDLSDGNKKGGLIWIPMNEIGWGIKLVTE